MAAPLYTTASGLLFHAGKILVLTVGLPARGKTHISRALERYLRWLGIRTLVVSLGDYRRKALGSAQQIPKDYFTLEGEKSEETKRLRAKVAEGCEQQIFRFFEQMNGQVVIYDANNGTRAGRQAIAERFDKRGIHVVFLESVCDNEEIIEANIRSVKISSPDYKGWDPERAVEDYYGRIRDHERYYEPVTETNWPFIRIFNVGDKIEVNDIKGYLQSRIIFFLMNIHNKFRTIYFARSGQSLIEHSYKADSDLSPAGWEYATRLKDFVLERRAKALEARGMNPAERKLVIWTSARRRAHHTAWPFVTHAATYGPSAAPTPGLMSSNPGSRQGTPLLTAVTNSAVAAGAPPPLHLPEAATIEKELLRRLGKDGTLSEPPKSDRLAPPGDSQNPAAPKRLFSSVKVIEKQQMSEINPGVWDGLSPEKAQELYPEEWARFLRDPYAFRAPRAESYHDLCVRLEPILIELEREQEDLLIIGHASVIRCLLAYLIGLPASEIPAIEVARGDLLEVRPASYGVHSQAYHFWDGPGRRGSSSGSGGSGSAKGLGLDAGPGKPKSRAGSAGAITRDKEKAKQRAASMKAGTEWWAASETANTIKGPTTERLAPGDAFDGAGGSGGAFGEAIASDGESDGGQDGDKEEMRDSQEVAGEEDSDSDGSANFYENVAEDTRGKRKIDIEFAHGI
ncbi:bifunctional 6-phosphofructo-2-kinase/fructose-2,6-bisphosphate 2-phosphatase [Fomitiporia mediterranea MF3/22]|uniref:bifunctional 6-phosphofructo-2-kinase/fructose-2,6-bisphosphate 2-phosphatase n=1 Tax=Fomitiporia mediterranea (strain MF3/22) TaxID=694068 RepID=UPI0004407B4C|nr:bifunctional 6-phosphofructo-2-kinase/fructose-2,6-bisphosphate 2-phosphatase [Fomitiporia mediterranea MF3/22]EJC99363.1 bifunctional 6-phosphofructo-2-kinase/fructose-2,6-bisphosphate 2-phosphatase [Fomitiporia mediterranea MF3/22]